MKLLSAKFIAAFAFTTTFSSMGQCFTVHECNDVVTRLPTVPLPYRIDGCSISSGNTRHTDVNYSLDEWNALRGMSDPFTGTWQANPGCNNITHGDDLSTIYFSTTDGDALAITHVIYTSDCFWWYSDQQIIEADLEVSSTYSFQTGNPPCNTYTPPDNFGLRTTLIHELGHAIGLQHDNDEMALMMSTDGEGRYCGANGVSPHPDDADGGRSMYDSGNSMTDIAASEFRRVGDDDVELNTTPGTTSLCRGASHSFKWSVGNRGTAAVTYAVRWYLSTDNSITSSDLVLATNTGASVGAGNFTTFDKTVTIPNTAVYGQTYFVGTIVDYNGTVTEDRENNNATYMARKIKIKTAAQCP